MVHTMTGNRLNKFPRDEFVALWNRAEGIEEVVNAVCQRVGRVPRWAVIAWAMVLRRKGTELKKFEASPVTECVETSRPNLKLYTSER
jgi:hypothetical protein